MDNYRRVTVEHQRIVIDGEIIGPRMTNKEAHYLQYYLSRNIKELEEHFFSHYMAHVEIDAALTKFDDEGDGYED